MQRKFLEDMGLEKDVIDRIMAENGSDINKTKEKLEAERDNYKSQLETAQETLKGFGGVDVKELQGKITQLTADLTAKETEYQQKLADRDFSDKLNDLISKSGGKNSKAIMALLDLESIKSSKNQDADLQAAIEKCKTDNGYMFGANEPFQNPVGQTNGGGGNAGITAETFAKMGYNQRMKIFSENPTLYKQLSGKE